MGSSSDSLKINVSIALSKTAFLDWVMHRNVSEWEACFKHIFHNTVIRTPLVVQKLKWSRIDFQWMFLLKKLHMFEN